jgi:hypothetical protein
MNLPPNRIAILILLWLYPILRVGQIRDRLFPNDRTGAIVRGHMRKLVIPGLVRKYQPKIVDPFGNGSAPPVYTLTCSGGSILAAATGDMKYLIQSEVSFANWISVNHWCSLSSLGMIINDAFDGKDYVKLTQMHFEHEVADPSAKEPWKKYLLYTKVSDKISFCPDMAFETDLKGQIRAWACEYETGSDSPARVAAKKCQGAALLGDKYAKFPNAKDFKVIAFCPNAGWRDSLRQAFSGKPGSQHWLFVATPDVKAATLLHEPIMYAVQKGPFSLLPRPA